MNRSASVLVLVAVLAAGPTLASCSQPEAVAADSGPVRLEEVPGSDIKKVVFTEEAQEAIGVKTAVVTAGPTQGQLTMPYAAVLYYTDGSTWTYVVSEERSYVRRPVTVATISGDVATLTAGPEAGSAVVVVGAPEILGAELEIAGEQ